MFGLSLFGSGGGRICEIVHGLVASAMECRYTCDIHPCLSVQWVYLLYVSPSRKMKAFVVIGLDFTTTLLLRMSAGPQLGSCV